MTETKVVHDLQVIGHRGNTPVLHEQFGPAVLVSVDTRTEDIGSTHRERTTITVIGPWKSKPVPVTRKKWWQL